MTQVKSPESGFESNFVEEVEKTMGWKKDRA
jgi:hypothetical protein